jgi:hypothetical protein
VPAVPGRWNELSKVTRGTSARTAGAAGSRGVQKLFLLCIASPFPRGCEMDVRLTGLTATGRAICHCGLSREHDRKQKSRLVYCLLHLEHPSLLMFL